MAAHLAYTQYARKYNQVDLEPAVNAAAPSYRGPALTETDATMSTEMIDEKPTQLTDEKKLDDTQVTEYRVANDSTPSLSSATPQLPSPVALFPQYIAQGTTTLTIRETGIPSFEGSFMVSDGTKDLFRVHHKVPSFRHKQHIIDQQTGEAIFTVRRNVGSRPRSYIFEDPSGKQVVDLQGNFFVPFSGAESTACLINAETGSRIALSMKGSYRNRHATIKDAESGEVLVNVESDVLELRNVLGGRRTYSVTVRGGVDLAMVTGLVVALDARAE